MVGRDVRRGGGLLQVQAYVQSEGDDCAGEKVSLDRIAATHPAYSLNEM